MSEKFLSIGLPKEIKAGERRVGLTPQGVKHIVSKKIQVFIERGAGEGSGFSDRMYLNSGAILVHEASELWKRAEIIVKVKEPQPEEFRFFQKKHILFTFLHLSSHKESHLVKALLKTGTTAIGYETIHKNGETSILKPMSEIAGYLSGYFACYVHQKVKVRAGEIKYPSSYQKDLLSIEKVFPKLKFPSFNGNILILGGGTVGFQAALALSHTKAHIWITEKNSKRIAHLKKVFMKNRSNIIVVDAQDRSIPSLMNKAHVVIGAVYVIARRAPILVDEEMLHDASHHHRKLIIDVAVDQGGNIFDTHPTTYDDPLFIDSFGNLRFGVANIPSICPGYASKLLEKVTLTYVIELTKGLKSAVQAYPEIVAGINIYKGKVVNKEVADIHRLFYEPLGRLS